MQATTNTTAMVVHTDMEISLQFSIEAHIVHLSIPFKAGDDAEQVLLDIIREEAIPVSLQDSLLCALQNLLQQERNAWQPQDLGGKDLEKNVASWASNFQQQHKRQQWSAPLGEELDHPSTAYEDLDEREAEDAAFGKMFHSLVQSSPEALSEVLEMERQSTVALKRMTIAKDEAIFKMQQQQAQEMDRHSHQMGRQAEPDQVARLVMRHVEQSEREERKWKQKIEEEITKQRVEYRKGIEQLAREAERGYLPDLLPEDKTLSLNFMNQSTPSGLAMAEQPVTAVEEKKKPSSLSLFSLFRRATSDDDDEEPQAEEAPKSPLDGEREALVEGSCAEFEFTASYGKLVGPAYKITVQPESLEDLLCRVQPPSVINRRVDTLLNLYSDSLVGAIMLSDTDMSFPTESASKLAERCHRAPELHFDSLRTQCDAVAQESRLEAGDFFITRHSSFDSVHVMFHLVASRNDLSYNPENPLLYDRSPVLSGLNRILEAASQCGVSRLHVPILLIEDGWQQAVSNPTIIKRAEQVLFRVRSFFLDSTSSRDGSLKTVAFMVPLLPGEEHFYGQCHDLVRNVFRGDC